MLQNAGREIIEIVAFMVTSSYTLPFGVIVSIGSYLRKISRLAHSK